jgi:hypothetical protein
VRTGLDAGAAEDDAGDVDKYVDDAGDFVVAEVDVKVVGCGIEGETLTEETEEEENDDEVTEVVPVVVAIAEFVLVEENVEEWLLVLDTVDDAELVLFSELDRICEKVEAVATDVCVAVRVECVMGLEFGTLWHTSYTEMALASKTSKAQAEARQTKASSPSVRPDSLLLVHKQ